MLLYVISAYILLKQCHFWHVLWHGRSFLVALQQPGVFRTRRAEYVALILGTTEKWR